MKRNNFLASSIDFKLQVMLKNVVAGISKTTLELLLKLWNEFNNTKLRMFQNLLAFGNSLKLSITLPLLIYFSINIIIS